MGNTLWDRLPAHEQQLDRACVATAVVAPLACLAAAAVAWAWQDSWPAARFLALYVAPLFLAAPLWARERLRAFVRTPRDPAWRLVVDVAVVLLSVARFVAGETLTFSGHMLFLTYTALLPASRAYRVVTAGLLVETTVFKLVLWNDVTSWSLGLVLGVLAAGVVGARQRQST
jgi:hypothetical protein